jgi:CheY-like chemotaxis protein
MSAPRILIADDEIIIARELEARLKGLGYDVVGIAASGEDALQITLETKPDLILMDLVLRGELDGIETADRILKQSKVPIIFLTAYRGASNLVLAKVTGPFGYIVKPFDVQKLQALIERALDEQRTNVNSETPDDG